MVHPEIPDDLIGQKCNIGVRNFDHVVLSFENDCGGHSIHLRYATIFGNDSRVSIFMDDQTVYKFVSNPGGLVYSGKVYGGDITIDEK